MHASSRGHGHPMTSNNISAPRAGSLFGVTRLIYLYKRLCSAAAAIGAI